MFNNVIVGIDDQSGSRDAIELARILRAEGGQLTLAHVHPGEMMPIHVSNRGQQAAERGRSLELLATP